jgi:hypothetical protein
MVNVTLSEIKNYANQAINDYSKQTCCDCLLFWNFYCDFLQALNIFDFVDERNEKVEPL